MDQRKQQHNRESQNTSDQLTKAGPDEAETDRLGQVSGPPKDEPELNRAQADSDAPPDAVAEGGASDGDPVNTSDSSGLREDDEAAGDLRKKQYRDGAGLVSSID